jgi:hypothetical protein
MGNVGVISLDCDELVVTASAMDRFDLLSDDEVIQSAAELLPVCAEGEGLGCDLSETPLIREMRKSIGGESRHGVEGLWALAGVRYVMSRAESRSWRRSIGD